MERADVLKADRVGESLAGMRSAPLPLLQAIELHSHLAKDVQVGDRLADISVDDHLRPIEGHTGSRRQGIGVGDDVLYNHIERILAERSAGNRRELVRENGGGRQLTWP